MKFHLNLGGVKQTNFSTNLSQKLKEFTSQLLLIALLTAATPVETVAAADAVPVTLLPYTVETSQVTFDTSKVTPLSIPTIQPIAMTLGESRAQETARLAAAEAARKAALAAQAKKVTIRVVRVDTDLTAKRALVQRAAAAYNIPWEVLEAVWQVESGKSWDTQVRSYAGAQGPAQFMPATWRRYGVDGNGDGVKDIYSAEDAVYGAANYLAANGANRGDMYRALFAYNHADWYVQKVLRVAREIGYTG